MGYAGILSLATALFALGAIDGMYLMRQIGTRGVYQNRCCRLHGVSAIPELPWFWWGFDIAMRCDVMLVPVSSRYFAVAFRRASRVYRRHPQAMTYALWLAFSA